MRKCVALFLAFAALATAVPCTAQVSDLSKTFKNFVINDTTDTCYSVASQIQKALEILAEEDAKQSKLRGKTTLGFDADQAGDDDLYNLRAGVSVAVGNYPSQLETAFDINVRSDDGALRETVSNLRASYDHHTRLWMENFVFVDRFGDSFMSIDSRYEFGGGTTFAWWTGMPKDSDIETKRGQLVAVRPDSASFEQMVRCWADVKLQAAKNNSGANEVNEDPRKEARLELDRLRRAAKSGQAAAKKRASRVRIGVLAGFFAEVESATLKDSVTVGTITVATDSIMLADTTFDTAFRTEPVIRRTALRWEIRPTFDYRPTERITLKFRPYLKFPMPWDWRTTLAGEEDTVFDFRLDLHSEVSVKLTDKVFFQNGDVQLTFTYRYIFDRVPPSVSFIDEVTDSMTIEPVYLRGKRQHHIARLSFTFTFS